MVPSDEDYVVDLFVLKMQFQVCLTPWFPLFIVLVGAEHNNHNMYLPTSFTSYVYTNRRVQGDTTPRQEALQQQIDAIVLPAPCHQYLFSPNWCEANMVADTPFLFSQTGDRLKDVRLIKPKKWRAVRQTQTSSFPKKHDIDVLKLSKFITILAIY